MKKTLLLIHDDQNELNTLAGELSDLTQMIIIRASDGIQACQKARNQKFDLIVSKWKIPKISGAELIGTIKATPTNESTPLIVIGEIPSEDQVKLVQICKNFKHIEIISGEFNPKSLSEKILNSVKKHNEVKKFKLDVNFINPFIEASIVTLKEMCKIENINSDKPFLMSNFDDIKFDISGTLAIKSPYFKGSIAISFTDDVYKILIGNMMGEEILEINLDNQEGAAEIINIIFGKTKLELNKQGYDVNHAIPNVLRGEKHQIYPNSKIPVLMIPFKSDVGNFYMQICVKAN